MKCCNSSEQTRDVVETHLIVYGILIGYIFWYHHGEIPNEPQSNSNELDAELLTKEDEVDGDWRSQDEIDEMRRDLFLVYQCLTELDAELGSSNAANLAEKPNYGAKKFFGLLHDLE